MNKNSNITVETIVNYLMVNLDCNQRIIANFTGLNESTLSANIEKNLREVTTKKTGKRLIALYLAVHQLASLGVSATATKEALNEFVYEDLDGNFDSAVSAVISDKYPTTVIVNIGELGYQQYKEKLVKRDELYPAVKEAIAAAG